MNLIYQTIDEKEEIFYEFFEANKKQLKFYKSLFDKYDTLESEIIKIIRENIKEDYIPKLSTWFISYKIIRKNRTCKSLVKSIHYLSKINSEDFLYTLNILLNEITKLNTLNK
jgi:hypothetical protein